MFAKLVTFIQPITVSLVQMHLHAVNVKLVTILIQT